MAVAWIVWRSPNRVREYWDAYRRECWDWHFHHWRVGVEGPVYDGYFLEERSPASLVRLHLSESLNSANDSEPEPITSLKGAEHACWQALQEGLLEATGLSRQTGERTPIAAHEWRDLEYFEERNRDVVRARRPGALPSGGYDDVVMPRKGVVALWAEQRQQAPLRLPETMRPSGAGYMPLYCAAQWIATEGGITSFDPLDLSAWEAAFADLLAHLASEEVKVVGVRQGASEPVAGHHFASCAIDYPFQDAPIELILGEELHLRSYPYLDEEHWRRGFDDALVDRRGARWRRLMVLRADVARCWPFGTSEPLRTGAPGRPTSMQLVDAEFERRIVEGRIEKTLAAEARALERWLPEKHPNYPRATKTTIENNIRGAFWRSRDLENKDSR
jgi:hypothetical protein